MMIVIVVIIVVVTRTAQSKHFLKLPARKTLGIRWAKYPFSRCRTCPNRHGHAQTPAEQRPPRIALRKFQED